MSKNEIMELLKDNGVHMELQGNVLHIYADLSREEGISSSGKSMVVCSTHGNQSIAGTTCKIGLNIYKPVKLK
jgi:hypothetical protein